jgi:hypothetical protein
LGTNTAPAGNPTNHGNSSNSKQFVFDDLTLDMIKALCAKERIEIKKINDIENSKTRPIIYLKSLDSFENIPWLYDTGAQATCLSEKLFMKILRGIRPKKLPTNRTFLGAGGQSLEPGGVYQMLFALTNAKGKSMTNDSTLKVIVMKTLNSGAIMGLDLIKRLDITFLSVEDKFVF